MRVNEPLGPIKAFKVLSNNLVNPSIKSIAKQILVVNTEGMNLLAKLPVNKAIPKIVVETTLMIKADLKGIFILLVA